MAVRVGGGVEGGLEGEGDIVVGWLVAECKVVYWLMLVGRTILAWNLDCG